MVASRNFLHHHRDRGSSCMKFQTASDGHSLWQGRFCFLALGLRWQCNSRVALQNGSKPRGAQPRRSAGRIVLVELGVPFELLYSQVFRVDSFHAPSRPLPARLPPPRSRRPSCCRARKPLYTLGMSGLSALKRRFIFKDNSRNGTFQKLRTHRVIDVREVVE